ncbi:hypothetical protein L917_06858 [Phytophthora nicotianae]|uniref:Uncharacterized protein n=1 Tax=Phytophthora nicotianae TaxID=4792 RepID=W2LF33_PHYNI|nr:hypothetical protein L917_06858 [Phytophthora nicotianae]ETM30845.1 hypothetical protein L914_21480 [Phytophthora nicotianae]
MIALATWLAIDSSAEDLSLAIARHSKNALSDSRVTRMVMSPEWDQATQCSGPVRNTSWPLDRGTRDRGTSSPMEENSPTAALQVGCRGLSGERLAAAPGVAQGVS